MASERQCFCSAQALVKLVYCSCHTVCSLRLRPQALSNSSRWWLSHPLWRSVLQQHWCCCYWKVQVLPSQSIIYWRCPFLRRLAYAVECYWRGMVRAFSATTCCVSFKPWFSKYFNSPRVVSSQQILNRSCWKPIFCVRVYRIHTCIASERLSISCWYCLSGRPGSPGCVYAICGEIHCWISPKGLATERQMWSL